MNQEKKLMQIGDSAGEYLAPRVKVVEIKARRVICGSDGGTTKMTFGDEYNGGFE